MPFMVSPLKFAAPFTAMQNADRKYANLIILDSLLAFLVVHTGLYVKYSS